METVLRKRVLIFLTVFAVGLGPGGWDGVNPLEKGAKKMSTHFLSLGQENEYSFS